MLVKHSLLKMGVEPLDYYLLHAASSQGRIIQICHGNSTWQEYIVKLLAFPMTCTVVVCGSFILSYIPCLNLKEFMAV